MIDSKYQIQRYRPEFKDKLIELLDIVDLPTSDLDELQRKNFFIIVSDAGDLVACLGFYPDEDYVLLRSVAVHPDLQGEGLAIELLAHAELYFRMNKVKQIFLLTTTAEGWFSRHGYLVISRDSLPKSILSHSQFTGLCPSSAVTMYKLLETLH